MLNGTYVAAGELVNGMQAYQKQDNADRWICRDAKGKWHNQSTTLKGQDGMHKDGFAYTTSPVKTPWAKETAWKVWTGKCWETQTAYMCTVQAPDSFAVSDFNLSARDGRFVRSGPCINGAPAYQKDTDNTKWICLNPHGIWMLQSTEGKGTNTGWCHTLEGRVPWDTGGHEWTELKDGSWVKMKPTISGVLMSKVRLLWVTHVE